MLAFISRLVSALMLLGLAAAPALAQGQPDEPERCPRLVAFDPWTAPPKILPAAYRTAQAVAAGKVRLTFIGHSTFFIESPAGVTIATDYNDYLRPPQTPEIATMNRAHDTHFSRLPDPGIKHLVPGWREDGKPARHELTVRDVWLRNVTTDIRFGFGSGPMANANSIFVFEVAGLCIAHLGHLHHTLTRDHFKGLGRIDVVLAPVDGSYTLNIDDMVRVLQGLEAPLIIPMHYFGRATLERFLDTLGKHYEVVRSDTPTVTLSRETLPKKPTVLVLPGR